MVLIVKAVAYQAPPSMEFSRQEFYRGVPFPSPGHLPDLGIEPGSPALQEDALPSEPPGKPHIKGKRMDTNWTTIICYPQFNNPRATTFNFL